MGALGLILASTLFLIGLLAIIFNGGKNLIMIVISLEIILLAIGLILIHYSFIFDDLIGIAKISLKELALGVGIDKKINILNLNQ